MSQPSRAERNAAVFPSEILHLFDDTFVRSCALIEEYVARLALQVFGSSGLAAACAEAISVDEAISRARLKPEVARVPVSWIFEMLAARGWIQASRDADGRQRYRHASHVPLLDPAQTEAEQAALDPRSLPSYRIAALAAEQYPAVLRGDLPGEDALFAAAGFDAWSQYFSNANPLYAVSNAMGAIAAERALPRGASAVLELGGGLGSGAEALLEHFEQAGRGADLRPYCFTELAPPFLRRAKNTLAARFPALTFGWLDIDQPFSRASLAASRFSLVYGVNVLHVARDLAATLAQIRAVLKDDGVLVIAECARPAPGVPIYVEFVFNLLSSFRDPLLVPGWRPNGGFLTPEQWRAALEVNGFRDVKVIPEGTLVRKVHPSFVVAAIVARRA
jgi:SAM-dependent methyltransferase